MQDFCYKIKKTKKWKYILGMPLSELESKLNTMIENKVITEQTKERILHMKIKLESN